MLNTNILLNLLFSIRQEYFVDKIEIRQDKIFATKIHSRSK